jgi:hypothetical protein
MLQTSGETETVIYISLSPTPPNGARGGLMLGGGEEAIFQEGIMILIIII